MRPSAAPEPVREEARSAASRPPSRLDSVDALRGAAVAGMILVNNPGTWSAVYPPLLHAEWSGWTYTDTIFPFFLFVSGVAMALSFSRRAGAGGEGATRSSLLRHLFVRAAILVGLGLALNAIGAAAFHREHLRIPGILQRIGVCALAAGAVYLLAGARGAAWAAAILLAGYWSLLGSGPLDSESNLAARVDRAVFGVHTWKPAFDPEGLLSTLPAIATVLLGLLAGELLRRDGARRAARPLALWGAAAAAAGLLWGRVFPINKTLWTSSYALLMSGLASLALAVLVEVVDRRGLRAWAAPLLWLGRNAIAAFTASTLGAIALIALRVSDPAAPGGTRSLWTAIYRTVFDRFADPRLGSLLFALSYLALWTAICGVLYRRRVFIKI